MTPRRHAGCGHTENTRVRRRDIDRPRAGLSLRYVAEVDDSGADSGVEMWGPAPRGGASMVQLSKSATVRLALASGGERGDGGGGAALAMTDAIALSDVVGGSSGGHTRIALTVTSPAFGHDSRAPPPRGGSTGTKLYELGAYRREIASAATGTEVATYAASSPR